MRSWWSAVLLVVFTGAAGAADSAREVSFPTSDGGEIHALLRGDGEHAVVLAHGKAFDKESWNPLAEKLAARGLTVLAIDFRGYGKSRPGSHPNALHEDVLGAVRYLQKRGTPQISLLGASMGGAAVSAAAGEVEEGEIDRVILLAPAPLAVAEGMRGYKVLIFSRGEPLAPRLEERFQLIPAPKRLVILPGSAHAQHVFATEYGHLLLTGIVDFLLKPPDDVAVEPTTSR
jgi:pimeloyl-ACP methyl ester carboxylesterase